MSVILPPWGCCSHSTKVLRRQPQVFTCFVFPLLLCLFGVHIYFETKRSCFKGCVKHVLSAAPLRLCTLTLLRCDKGSLKHSPLLFVFLVWESRDFLKVRPVRLGTVSSVALVLDAVLSAATGATVVGFASPSAAESLIQKRGENGDSLTWIQLQWCPTLLGLLSGHPNIHLCKDICLLSVNDTKNRYLEIFGDICLSNPRYWVPHGEAMGAIFTVFGMIQSLQHNKYMPLKSL